VTDELDHWSQIKYQSEEDAAPTIAAFSTLKCNIFITYVTTHLVHTIHIKEEVDETNSSVKRHMFASLHTPKPCQEIIHNSDNT